MDRPNFTGSIDDPDGRSLMTPKPVAEFTNNVIVETDNIELDNQSFMNEMHADIMLGMKSIDRGQNNDLPSVFVVEKGEDG